MNNKKPVCMLRDNIRLERIYQEMSKCRESTVEKIRELEKEHEIGRKALWREFEDELRNVGHFKNNKDPNINISNGVVFEIIKDKKNEQQ